MENWKLREVIYGVFRECECNVLGFVIKLYHLFRRKTFPFKIKLELTDFSFSPARKELQRNNEEAKEKRFIILSFIFYFFFSGDTTR